MIFGIVLLTVALYIAFIGAPPVFDDAKILKHVQPWRMDWKVQMIEWQHQKRRFTWLTYERDNHQHGR